MANIFYSTVGALIDFIDSKAFKVLLPILKFIVTIVVFTVVMFFVSSAFLWALETQGLKDSPSLGEWIENTIHGILK